ncbi:hypothetical protein MF265_22260 [Serratia marcescens]|uniref:hypothetical protein n=1 Tax=Serratia marcescens TaxID=615 RepID=UPI001EEFD913|nr:hypothetical protein [Serratia marcescens]ULH10610.1 hypothetical protein MF265_22260 [Serratia marcescens]
MNRFTISVSALLGLFLGLSAVTAQASEDTSAAIAPLVVRGPGPVINPENSQYMDEKKAAMTKQVQQHQAKQAKHHSKKTKHHAKKHHKKSRN